MIRNVFYLKFCDECIIKIDANKSARNYFDNYFQGCVFDNPPQTKPLFEITYKGKIGDFSAPSESVQSHAFMGCNYNTWFDDNRVYAYAFKDQKMGSHLISRDGSKIDVYLQDGVDEEIISRTARECYFRYFLSLGYIPLHASGYKTPNGKISLYFGNRNAGKTLFLCDGVVNENANPISNDLILVKRNGEKFDIYGWPLNVRFHKKMVDLFGFNLDTSSINDTKKMKLKPKEFTDLTGKNWIWHADNIDNFYYLNPNENEKYSVSIVDKKNNEFLFPFMIDDNWYFGDFMLFGQSQIDYGDFLNNIQISEIKGDYIGYVKQRSAKKLFE